jgi:hypothetical protein
MMFAGVISPKIGLFNIARYAGSVDSTTSFVCGMSAAVPNQSFPFALANWSKYGPGTVEGVGVLEGVDVGVAVAVTRQEHADATREGLPPQFEAKVGKATPAEGVNVGQKAETAAEARMN